MTTTPPYTVRIRPVDPPRRRRTGLALIVGAGVVLLATGGAVAFGVATAASLRTESSSESVAGVAEVVIDVDAGFVALRGGTGPDVEVRTTRIWAPGSEPVVERRLEGGVLTLTSDCPAFDLGCEVEREIVVPAGTSVRARTVASDVEAVGIDVPRFTATTVGGSVTASFSVPPDEVAVQTVSGDALLTVPPAAYRVTTATVTGRERVDVAQDPADGRTVSVRTVSGAIEILPG
ncbi:hypothetical protein [Pseudonocardia broussonetiae]|uniref:Adhesin domain-containing protein n=1 Tax=Pseudonocardia broussonetiae TaxID=2736640 RepID=A0A6M6JK55_9PSEU|nr:hypothetical protein [Pseudonocardia broussonetiae]QJY47430.1 hypothetical protein HOP40_17765 [Pseudonocardia broussonetiae]